MMTNRERLIDLLNRTNYETDMITASFIACPYYSDDNCHNPHDYGTTDFQIFCDECKEEWLDKEAERI